MKSYIALSILLSGLCLNSAGAGAALRAAETQYEGNRMLATDEPTAFEPTPVAAPVPGSEPTAAAVGDNTVCAKHDERSVQCGAISDDRPSACCEGLSCQGKKCIDPDMADTTPGVGDSCASEGVRSQQCGATRGDLPATCCEGLVCEDSLEGVKCVVPAPGGEPASEPADDEDSTCAASGVRSQQCGATRSDLPATCCKGLVCEGDGSVKCIEGETLEPTKAPVVAPTAAAAPTYAPIMIELEPTGEPTPEPTGVVEILPPSSATSIAAKAALATAVAVPMFFF